MPAAALLEVVPGVPRLPEEFDLRFLEPGWRVPLGGVDAGLAFRSILERWRQPAGDGRRNRLTPVGRIDGSGLAATRQLMGIDDEPTVLSELVVQRPPRRV